MATRQRRLDKQTILQAAREVLDNTGLDGFTTRALASHLDVQQPGLYWHFKTKGDLLAALASDILVSEHHASFPEVGESWDAFLLRNARSFRRALLAVRDGARLHAEHHIRPPDADAAQQLEGPRDQLSLLIEQGFSEEDAINALVAIGRYTVGVVLEEQSQEGNQPGKSERDQQFEFGLKALVIGIGTEGMRGSPSE